MHGGKNPRWLHKRSLERRILGAAYGRGNHHVRGTPRAEKTQRQRDDDAVNRPHNDHCAGGFSKAQPALTSSGIARRIPSWCAAEPGLLRWRLGQETRFFVPARKSLHCQAWHARREVSGICRHSWGLWGAPGHTRHGALPNCIPEAAPYNGTEAKASPLPYEDKWITITHPRLCASCHPQIFQEWHGSRMANSWHDPGWRGARGIPVCRWAEPATSGGDTGHQALDGACGAAWGRPDPTAEARRGAANANAYSVLMRGGREARERALHKNACTCCCPARRHGWDSAGLQTPVRPSGQHPATGRCLVAGISGLLSFSSWHR